MAKKGRIKKIAKTFVNVPAWMGYSHLKESGQEITGVAKRLFKVQKPEHSESFDEAVKRMALTEEDILRKKREMLRLAVFYCVIAVGVWVYAGYLFFHGHFPAALLSVVISVVILTFAFREHFWFIQMKHRRLGCTVKDWLSLTIKGPVK